MVDFMRTSRGYGSNSLSKLALAGITAGVLSFVGMAGFFMFSQNINPGYQGIKINKLGGGIEQGKLYGAGRYLTVPGVHEFKTFPKTLQFISAGSHQGEVEDTYDSERRIPPLTVELSGGGQVFCDYTLVYRITDPFKVLKIGPGKICEDSEIIPRSTNTLRKHLGELIAEEFYVTTTREPKVEEAKIALNQQLNPLGIEVTDVLLRFFSYPTAYQDKIELKILEEQLKLEAESQTMVATKKGEADTKGKEWEAKAQFKLREAENARTKILAEADSYLRTKRAEGDLLVKEAEARGKELISRSLEGAGGERVAALKAVEMLRDLDVYIFDSSQVNIFDTMRMIEQLEGTNKPANAQQGGN